jgi:DNA-binding NarL/FixJ family response regulator
VRVLVVDDQLPFQGAAREVIESMESFEVAAIVDTGEAAVRAVQLSRPDLVLLDLNLPGISGLEAARRITSLPDPPVVLLLSTYDIADYGDELDRCGARGFLTKLAFGPERLAQEWGRIGT